MSITLTALATGGVGNTYNVTFFGANAPNQVLAASIVGVNISVTLATSPGNIITSTEGAVVAAMLAVPGIAALVSVVSSAPAFVIPNFAGSTTQFLSGGSGGTGGGYAGLDPGNFKILLLDTNQIATANVPLLFSNLIHVPRNAPNLTSTAHANATPSNFWPTPAMMYRRNSSIRFNIFVTSSTPLAVGSTWDFLFTGVQRYPCL